MEIKNINEASEKLQEALIIRNNALKIRDINVDNVEKVRKLFENDPAVIGCGRAAPFREGYSLSALRTVRKEYSEKKLFVFVTWP